MSIEVNCLHCGREIFSFKEGEEGSTTTTCNCGETIEIDYYKSASYSRKNVDSNSGTGKGWSWPK